MSDLDRDRRWCRVMLPRVSRTFALNIRLLAGSFRDAVECAYLWCRVADTLEDGWPGTAAETEERFARLRLAADAARLPQDRADVELVRGLPSAWRVLRSLDVADRQAIVEALHVMGAG